MTKPNFIGVGGHKCASTWLSECLRYHPEIFMSEVKEIHYFTQYHDKGMEWYLKHFESAGEDKIMVGEFSTPYLYDPKAAERIFEDLGTVKILVTVRDPLSRFISQYKHLMRLGRLERGKYAKLDSDTFKSATEAIPMLLTRGLYAENIKRYMDLFGSENVFTVFNDDIEEDPRKVLREVFDFLGVDADFVPETLKKRVGAGIVPRHMWLEKLKDKAYHAMKRIDPRLINFIHKSGLSELYRKLNAGKEELTVTDDARRLIAEYYAPEVDAMEKLFSRKLPKWHHENIL